MNTSASIEAIPVNVLASAAAVEEGMSKLWSRAIAAGIRLTAMRELLYPDPFAVHTPNFTSRVRIFETGRP
jgi:hypothetical protein